MIKTFRHKGLETFYQTGSLKGIQPQHACKLSLILGVLDAATAIEDIKSVPALRCHALKGERQSEYAVTVNGNWRVTFEFERGHIYSASYEDYH